MAKANIQWHPLLGRLLRRRVEGYYELLTGMPVGDLPRQADIVLLRRTGTSAPPFRGLWGHLTAWNVLEYKGPTVSPRRQHLPLLVEVGLGIDRRLNAENAKKGERPTPEQEVSFWYVANRLGRGFLQAAASRLQGFDAVSEGLWKGKVLGHPCFLVSAVELPVDDDSLPLHVIGLEPLAQQLAVGQFVIEAAERLDAYGSMFAALHPAAWKEVKAMAVKRGALDFDLRPIVEELGLDKVIEKLGKKDVLEQMNIDDILQYLTPTRRRELLRRLSADSKRSGK